MSSDMPFYSLKTPHIDFCKDNLGAVEEQGYVCTVISISATVSYLILE